MEELMEEKIADIWFSAPEWANYLAQSKSGSWFFFKKKPVQCSAWWGFGGQSCYAHFDKGPIADWKNQLFERPLLTLEIPQK